MIKKLNKVLSTLVIGALCLSFFTLSVLALNEVEYSNHNLSLSIPEEYVVLDENTAEDNSDLIESMGYTVSSFNTFLKPNSKSEYATIFLGVEKKSNSQILVRTDQTEFSKKIGDFSYLDDDAVEKTAKELIKIEKATYKTATSNEMKFIEIRFTDKDSGGRFSSIQYMTVRNGRIYTLVFNFEGKLTDSQVDLAWETLKTLEIEDVITKSPWDFETILFMVLLCAAIIVAVIVLGILIFTIIRDFKNKKSDFEDTPEYIRRRDKKPRWK